MSLQNNLPHENLNDVNDLIGIYPKAAAIKAFFEKNLDNLDNQRMIVLYGPWGTGKTTLMKFLEDNLERRSFKTLFFEPWKHERDDNLTFSLLTLFSDALIDVDGQKEHTSEKVKTFLKSSWAIFKGLVSSVNLTYTTPVGLEVGVNPKDFFESFTKEATEKSYLQKEIEFRKAFHEIEDEIATRYNLSKNGKIIILIDDLDRCEPEKTVELLSIIKLFFTYGKRTIFFSGIDKEAVARAIQRKYDNVIKAEDYLEKIYDISFNLDATLKIDKLIQQYFPKRRIKANENHSTLDISDFFCQMGFTTPRHVKKILNKYEILKMFKKDDDVPDDEFAQLIPNLIGLPYGHDLDTILTLYVIILYEFDRKLFNEVSDYEEKIIAYSTQYLEKFKENNKNGRLEDMIPQVEDSYKNHANQGKNLDILQRLVHQHRNQQPSGTRPQQEIYLLLGFLSRFLPAKTTSGQFEIAAGKNSGRALVKQFQSQNNRLSVNFCNYINNNWDNVMHLPTSNYEFDQIFKMASLLL
jgi:energy-coupling factor transporter ATP-binding protein EcfA2